MFFDFYIIDIAIVLLIDHVLAFILGGEITIDRTSQMDGILFD